MKKELLKVPVFITGTLLSLVALFFIFIVERVIEKFFLLLSLARIFSTTIKRSNMPIEQRCNMFVTTTGQEESELIPEHWDEGKLN